MTPTPRERVIDMLDELQFKPDRYFIGGSGVLALRNIRHIGSDLDIGTSTHHWFGLQALGDWEVRLPHPQNEEERCDPPYLVRKVHGIEVHVFYAWRFRYAGESPYNDFNRVFRDGIDWTTGYPCIRLPTLLRQKIDAVQWDNPRLKDINDIQLITSYMRGGGE